eukprot:3091764-Amphidinium_carterae.2
MDKCNPSTTPGNKEPPIAAQPLDKEQHSMFRTAVGQLLWVSQLRVDISFAVKEYIKGTTHYKVSLAPKAQHNEQGVDADNCGGIGSRCGLIVSFR